MESLFNVAYKALKERSLGTTQRHTHTIQHDKGKKVKKGKATLFIHGLCLKLEACGAVFMKQILNKHNMIKNPNLLYPLMN